MSPTATRGPAAPMRRRGPGRVLALALLGSLTMTVALTVAGVGNVVMTGRQADDSGVALFTGALCAGIAIPAVLVLRSRVDGRDLRSLGLPRAGPASRQLLAGAVATTVVAGGTLALATRGEAIAWGPVDPVQVAYFVVTNAVIALLLEALPEEIVYRGYVLTTITESGRPVLAAVVTTCLFALMPGLGTVLQAGAHHALGLPPEPVGLAPGGQDPVSYLVLMVLFGASLVAVRRATGSVWFGVGMHLAFLTINRIVLEGAARDAGASARLVEPDVVLLLPLYVVLAALLCTLGARLRRGLSSTTRSPIERNHR